MWNKHDESIGIDCLLRIYVCWLLLSMRVRFVGPAVAHAEVDVAGVEGIDELAQGNVIL